MSRSVRQQARAQTRELQAARRRERAEADRRRSDLGIQVAVALSERDEAVATHELTAGHALLALTTTEGVNLTDVEQWVPGLSTAEIRRLCRCAEGAQDERRAQDDPHEAEVR